VQSTEHPMLVPIESSCNFLLVINTNVHPILHHFQVMADYWSNRRVPHFNAITTSDCLWIWP